MILLSLLFLSMTMNAFSQEAKQEEATHFPAGSVSLRSNALPWLLLMPNLGIEYKPTERIGLLVDGGCAHWNLNTRNKYWRMWNVAPQARYYAGRSMENYIGLQYTVGEYNLSGFQGKYMGGGLALGHQFYCAKNLLIDLGLTLGYLRLYDQEEYKRIDGHNYRIKDGASHNYWGPTALSVTLVWKLNR